MSDPGLRYHLDSHSVSRSGLVSQNGKLNADLFLELFGLLCAWLRSSGSVAEASGGVRSPNWMSPTLRVPER